MAKLKGPLKIRGSLGDITFIQRDNGYFAMEKSRLDGKRIASDPSFERTRENMAEFARAGKAGKLVRQAVRILLQNASDNNASSRLTSKMMEAIKADMTSVRGQRNVPAGNVTLVKGFEFNNRSKLGSTLYAPYTTSINRAGGLLNISIPSFVPALQVAAPEGTTHFKIVSAGAEADFDNDKFITDIKDSGILPWDHAATADISLDHTVPAASTQTLLLVLGIQFYQSVGGNYSPLKNGVFNALTLIETDKV